MLNFIFSFFQGFHQYLSWWKVAGGRWPGVASMRGASRAPAALTLATYLLVYAASALSEVSELSKYIVKQYQ